MLGLKPCYNGTNDVNVYSPFINLFALSQYIDEEEDGSLDAAKVLHSQSLGQVYSTMEESMPEATVQLLADLLQPGFYPPKDISAHLLRGLLLGARCPLNLRVQAFDLLMKTQR